MKRHKYNAQKTKVDGIWFDSKHEANVYLINKSRLQAGEISNLILQPQFELQPGFTDNRGKKVRPIRYIADFQYNENGITIVEDAKGKETKEFRLKAKMFRYKFPELILRITKY